MSNLIIEILVEACLLESDKVVNNPLGSYDSLPWEAVVNNKIIKQKIDVNYDNPYLSDEILAAPFQNDNNLLSKGVHLHWIVPSFLGREYNDKMPAAPNRWLIKRIEKNSSVNKEWLVVSDYVQFPNAELEKKTINNEEHYTINIDSLEDYSVFPNLKIENNKPPFCYVGKSFDLKNLPQEANLKSNSFLNVFGEPLTVLGFGNPQFSASYPNCKTVFGFHDEDGVLGNSYQITGWHDDDKDDILLKDLQNINITNQSEKYIKEYLKDKFNIKTGEEKITIPDEKTLYIAKIELDSQPNSIPDTNNLQVVVGNTASEVFSCLVAHKQSQNATGRDWAEKVKTEDQLEMMLLSNVLDDATTDKFAKFFEARHKLGFISISAGNLYALTHTHIGKTEEFGGYELSDAIKGELNKLNLLKHNNNQAKHQLDSLIEQLYADWHKYMRAYYLPIDSKGDLPDVNKIKHLIKVADLNTILKHENLLLRHEVEGKIHLNNFSHLYDSELRQAIDKTSNIIYKLEDELENIANGSTIGRKKLEEKLNKYIGVLELIKKEIEKQHSIISKRFLFSDIEKSTILDFKEPIRTETLKKYLKREVNMPHLLKEIPEAPYWEAKEPVIAIDGFHPSEREEETLVKFSKNVWTKNSLLPLVSGDALNRVRNTKFSSLSWVPLFMEWEVDIRDSPIKLNDNFKWPEPFKKHFYLDQDTPGIYRNPDEETHPQNDSLIQGSIILNHSLDKVFVDGMEDYIEKLKTKHNGEEESKEEKELVKKNIELAESSLNVIKQSTVFCQRLAGFNAACLMKRSAPQLKIKEPLGFPSSKRFSDKVKSLCKDQKQFTPMPNLHFLPIRNGELILKRLKLIDGFGTSVTLDKFDNIVASDTLTAVELRNKIGNTTNHEEGVAFTKQIFLPPRLTQPSKLNVHFLNNDSIEYEGYANSNPIYGWFIVNVHDKSIMVYSSDGIALGSLQSHNESPDNLKKGSGWYNLPWEDQSLTYENKIENSHFRNLIKEILEREAESTENEDSPGFFISSFLDALIEAQANVAPNDFALHDSRILFTGHPIAITRVSVSFLTKGNAAIDQSWESLYFDMEKADRLSHHDLLPIENRHSTNWNDIDLPLRLGEHAQLNDGVLGYWIESPEGQLEDKFYAPETEQDESSFIESRADGDKGQNFMIDIKPNGSPQNFTVLLDPRGIIHATTGVLPTTTLSIENSQFKEAIQKMNMWFKTGPIMKFEEVAVDGKPSNENVLLMNTPEIDGFEWAWQPLHETEKGQQSLKLISNDKILERTPKITFGYLILKPKSEGTTLETEISEESNN